MTDSFGFLVVTFIIILGFEAVNGWPDAPNAIATVSSTAWYFGLPTSESHGIVSGLAGAAVATSGGFDVLQWDGWRKVFEGVALAVVAGFVGAFLVMVAGLVLFPRVAPALGG